MTLDQDLHNQHQGRLIKTTIRTSTLNSSDMTRTNVTDIKVAYRPNHESIMKADFFANNVIYLFRHETLLDENPDCDRSKACG